MAAGEPGSYVGRFAPSPTGPLHFGSLVAAVASYLQARVNRGRWLLRIEDIDPPREQPGAANDIVSALELYGFKWDGEVQFQSASQALHQAALNDLLSTNLAYYCCCSRRDLADEPRSVLGTIYPGTCRPGPVPEHRLERNSSGDTAIRILTDNELVTFRDDLQGRRDHRLESESGDFVIRRRDQLIAYQLAVVVDDHHSGITEVVRGIDLIDSTPRQLYLQRLLGYPTPRYLHVPVVTHANGDKLSKLTGAPAISRDNIIATLISALAALQQDPPASLHQSSLQNVWSWAEQNWRVERLARQSAIANGS